MKTFYSIFLLISAFFISFSHGLQAQITATQCIINSSMYGSAIGYKTTATGKYSFASGYGVRALADHSFIFGTVPGGSVIHGSAIISNNTKNSFLIAFGGKPLFMAKLAPLSVQGNPGNSTQGIDPNTEEDYSGVPAVGIGTIDPQETLDVRGNVKADTVKINHSIFISGQSLSITQRSPGTWGGGGNPGTLEIETDTISSNGGGIAPPAQNEIETLATMKYYNGPKFGIGITNPQAALHVNGQGRFENTVRIKDNQSGIINAALFVGGETYITEGGLMIGKTSLSRNLKLQVDGNSYFNGNVGIGTVNTFGYTLAVNGNIGCKELKVEVTNSWPDEVFADDYNLRSLDEVASYIQKNKHLPEVPSAVEVYEKGINVGAMNATLLKKVEELTLYIISLQKQIDELKKE